MKKRDVDILEHIGDYCVDIQSSVQRFGSEKTKELRLNAHAKINLGLDVLLRRPDGYHDLRMVMQTVGLCDEITLRVADSSRANAEHMDEDGNKGEADIRLFVSGANGLVSADSSNLAYRAARLLKEEFGIRQGLEIDLKKRIPVAAGLAGGSADAAAVLVGVNDLFALGLSKEELMDRGVKLGADVPYCILRGTVLAEGIGERLTPLPPAPEAYVLLAKPPVAVSTKFVYSNLKLEADAGALSEKTGTPCVLETTDSVLRQDGGKAGRNAQQGILHPDIDSQVRAIRDGDLYRMAALMGNVLETVTEPAFPVIGEIKRRMIELGAINAMMSGSGPTVFGLFDDPEKAKRTYEEFSEGTLAAEVFLTDYFQPKD